MHSIQWPPPAERVVFYAARAARHGLKSNNAERPPPLSRRGPPLAKCPLVAGGVLLSHGLAPQYHRRSGA